MTSFIHGLSAQALSGARFDDGKALQKFGSNSIYIIHPELRIYDCYSRMGERVGPL